MVCCTDGHAPEPPAVGPLLMGINMSDEVLDSEGHLSTNIRPAIYFDSSVLIDYWLTEGAEMPEEVLFPNRELPYIPIIRDLLKTDKRFSGMVEVRKALLFGKLKAFAVTSPISIIELIEWYSETSFKNLATEAAGAPAIQRKSKKEIGDLLRKLIERRRQEYLDKKGKQSNGQSTPIDLLVSETWLDAGFAKVHGLQGVITADIKGFTFKEFDIWDVAQILAYLQMGMADVIQLYIARHLGCTMFASFDSDYERCVDHIKDGLGLDLLRTPEEIVSKLR
jgi:hypothetical protein